MKLSSQDTLPPRPKQKPRAICYDLIRHEHVRLRHSFLLVFLTCFVVTAQFDKVIMVVILLNTLTMTFEHYQQTSAWTNFLYAVNILFISIFTLEGLLTAIAACRK